MDGLNSSSPIYYELDTGESWGEGGPPPLLLLHGNSKIIAYLQQSLGATILVSSLALLFGLFPGHGKGGFWPLYVPEHYGQRNSQHLLDPYSFVHFNHGILSFYEWGNEDDPIVSSGSGWTSMVGLVKALFAALAFEIIENTELLINLFRENSGTSALYRGDSSINVFGDLFSCALGFNAARYITTTFKGSFYWPLLLFIFIELVLALTIRDNMLLIIVQLVYPIKKIQEWQEEIIPKDMTPLKNDAQSEQSDWIPLSGHWKNKFASRRFDRFALPQQSLVNSRVYYMRSKKIDK